jgi:hypothetical protein
MKFAWDPSKFVWDHFWDAANLVDDKISYRVWDQTRNQVWFPINRVNDQVMNHVKVHLKRTKL